MALGNKKQEHNVAKFAPDFRHRLEPLTASPSLLQLVDTVDIMSKKASAILNFIGNEFDENCRAGRSCDESYSYAILAVIHELEDITNTVHAFYDATRNTNIQGGGQR